jgi:hypothetical protein
LEELQKSGTAANTARRTRNLHVHARAHNNLPTVPESSEGEEKEDLEVSETGMAIIADKRDGAAMMHHWHQLVKPQHFLPSRCHKKQQFHPAITQ